jgi:hypothetical protein
VIAPAEEESAARLGPLNCGVFEGIQSLHAKLCSYPLGSFEILVEKQVRVDVTRTWPIWPNAVRISVGTPAEMPSSKPL